jgi:hypothetical protein
LRPRSFIGFALPRRIVFLGIALRRGGGVLRRHRAREVLAKTDERPAGGEQDENDDPARRDASDRARLKRRPGLE